jgi:hypothetical protein
LTVAVPVDRVRWHVLFVELTEIIVGLDPSTQVPCIFIHALYLCSII